MGDQDFFFDDGGTAPKAPRKTARQSAVKAPASPARVAASIPFLSQSVSMTVTALVAVIALLVGVIIGIAIPVGGRAVDSGSPAATVAPALSQDQMSSGALPEGHPDISGMTGSTGTTGSATTTSSGN